MRISITTIAYNHVRYVEKTLRSVLDQSYPDVEYVVVDPGSTDGTREVIKGYRNRIQKLVFRPDRSSAEGLNNGFAEATGDIFGFLNSDDLLMPDALTKVARAFEDPDVDIVMGHMWVIDADGKRIRRAYTDRFNARAYAYGGCVICQQSTFFRASLFRRVGGFNAANRVAWDAELFLEMMAQANRCIILDEILSAFRIHDESITGSRRELDVHQHFFDEKFRRVMGRSWRRSDEFVRLAYFVYKYLREPRALRERLLRGCIIKRSRFLAPKY